MISHLPFLLSQSNVIGSRIVACAVSHNFHLVSQTGCDRISCDLQQECCQQCASRVGICAEKSIRPRIFYVRTRLSVRFLLTFVLDIRRIDEESPLAEWHFMSQQHVGGSERILQ